MVDLINSIAMLMRLYNSLPSARIETKLQDIAVRYRTHLDNSMDLLSDLRGTCAWGVVYEI
jgi:hypothetical protein